MSEVQGEGYIIVCSDVCLRYRVSEMLQCTVMCLRYRVKEKFVCPVMCA